MRTFVKAFAIASSIFAVFACNKEVPVQDDAIDGVKTVQFYTEPMTRTVFGSASGSSLPTLWTKNYCVALSLNYASAKKSTTPEVGEGSTTARFTAEIEDDDSGAYTFYAVSPYEQFVSINKDYTSVQITVPTAQTALDGSPDEKAQILFGKYNAGGTFPSSVTLPFEHLTAYGKIAFSNLALAEGESVASVSLTAAENWAGRYYYYVDANGDYAAGDYQANSASKTITIATNKTSDIRFGCAPVDLGGKTVDVVITTNKGTTYSKTITIPAGKQFEAGVVNAFTINMDGISADGAVVYNLVTDVADLTLGSEVIIVASAYNFAMSTTQNSNNRGQAAVTKSDNVINSPGTDVQVFTIANGAKGGTYAFSTGSGYICAASSSSNYLRTEEKLSANGSWTISIANDGVATVTAIGDYTRNVIQYNNGSSIFACYASASQKAISIYKKAGTGSGAIAPKVAESLSISGATTTYNVNDTFSFDGDVTLVYSDKSTASITSSEYTVDDSAVDMTKAGTYTVTIKYNADNTVNGSYVITVNGGDEGTTVSSTDLGSASTTAVEMDDEISYVNSASNTYSNPMRIYANNTFTISSKTKNITKVVYTCNSASYATALSGSTFTVDSGASTSVSVSGSDVTVTITGSTKSVAVKMSAQVRLDGLAVTYK